MFVHALCEGINMAVDSKEKRLKAAKSHRVWIHLTPDCQCRCCLNCRGYFLHLELPNSYVSRTVGV